MIKCHICKSTEITHYKQKRRDGVWVVTARCKNNHIPEKGKAFYPIKDFNLEDLKPLVKTPETEQEDLFKQQEDFLKSLYKKVPYRNYPVPVEEK